MLHKQDLIMPHVMEGLTIVLKQYFWLQKEPCCFKCNHLCCAQDIFKFVWINAFIL